VTPPIIWRPSADDVERAAITRFARALGRPTDYASLWRWSVEDVEGFWSAIWNAFGVAGAPGPVFGDRREMPGTRWFPEARLNYAEHLLRDGHDDAVAIHHASELRGLSSWTWGDLRRETGRIRAGLLRLGVERGDRVAAYLPNTPETLAAFLASASIGAIWTVAAPEFGSQSVVDRFAQVGPKVLLAVDGYRYGGKDFDRTAVGDRVAEATGARLVRFGHLDGSGWEEGFLGEPELAFADVPFDHPLWVLYSSGTTGLPKPIVHGHGGILLEQLKTVHLHLDARPEDRVLWFTTTGWMMWNYLAGVLLSEAQIVLYDGSPAGDALWDLSEAAGVTIFGTSAAYISACMKEGIDPAAGRELRIRAVGSTGSPLAPEGFAWVADRLGGDTWLFSMSGGSDVCTAFVGGVPTLPVHAGELQAPALGAKLEAWDPDGRSVIGELGELVLTEPLPSMPLCFWGDDDGSRLRESYFDTYPGVWRHGDWIELTDRGTAVIHGRSDATINRGGVRMGTSEIYRAVLGLDEITDALVVDVPRPDGDWMPLFVVLRPGARLDDDLRARIARTIREHCSPRHVPDHVAAIAEVPRTLSGKALEVPVKRILMGHDPERVVSRDALANPDALEPFVALARG
jgi:acetoacetyl-CoA synthetase